MAKKPLNVHVFSHTRWDREGLRTLSELRLHAVNLLDHTLEALKADTEGVTLVLDGQAILIEDYLSVRPRNVEAVTEAVKSGKLHIGPWYTLPHQQLASPEAIIRNLLIGTQIAEQLGGAFPVGYMPDAYGYLSQMPQILQGFGIGSAVIQFNAANSPGWGHWDGPDGSRLVAISLCQEPMLDANPAEELKREFAHTRDLLGADAAGRDVFVRLGVTAPVKALNGKLRGVKITVDDLASSPSHLAGAPQMSFESILGTPRGEEHPGSVSNRILLKLRNHWIETLLESWVEPFSAWAWLTNADHSMSHADPGLRSVDISRHVWRVLLQNHNQATIGGCAADGVYQEALLRFDQAEQLGEEIIFQNLGSLAARVATDIPVSGAATIPVVVFNAAGTRRTDLVTVEVALPNPEARYEVVDDTGERARFEIMRSLDDASAALRFVASDVPERGYKAYFLSECVADEPALRGRDEQPYIENEHLAITFDPSSGSLSIFDKSTGRSFDGLNHFVDEGDSGSLQEFKMPAHDTVIDIATNTPIFVEREYSDVEQSLTFLQIYRLPRQLTAQRDARLPLAAQFVPVSIITQVRLVPGVPRVDIRASVANDALDHRLRVHFAFGSDFQGCLADGHFEIRDLSPTFLAGRRSRKPHSVTTNQRAFVTLLGSDTGLTIANRGLPEVTISQGQDGVDIALTLIRATGLLKVTPRQGADRPDTYVSTPKAQCLGEHTFSYTIIPHRQDALLPAWQEAWAFQAPLRAAITGIHGGDLPTQGSLVAVDNPRFVISAVKTSEDGSSLIVRGYSISTNVETVTMRPGIDGLLAQRARIDETQADAPIQPDGSGGFVFEARPAEIVTIRFERALP